MLPKAIIYLLLFFVIVTAFATDSCTSLGSNLISPNTLIHTPCLSISSLDKGNKHSDYRQLGGGTHCHCYMFQDDFNTINYDTEDMRMKHKKYTMSHIFIMMPYEFKRREEIKLNILSTV